MKQTSVGRKSDKDSSYSATLLSHWIENHFSQSRQAQANKVPNALSVWLSEQFPSMPSSVLDEAQLSALVSNIQSMSVDEYSAQVLQPVESADRQPLIGLLRQVSERFHLHSEEGPLLMAEAEWLWNGSRISVAILAQNRQHANGVWRPEHHASALRWLKKVEARNLPLVTFIDTPGAAADAGANLEHQAHSISALIAAMAALTVPTVGIVYGVGYSGGAIPLATTNVLLSVRDGLFNTIQPKGLASIARRQHLSWQACAQQVGISAAELTGQGVLDGVIDFSVQAKKQRAESIVEAACGAIAWVKARSLALLQQCEPLVPVYLNHSLSGDGRVGGEASIRGWAIHLDRSLTLRSRLRFSDRASQLNPVLLESEKPSRPVPDNAQRDTRFNRWLNRADKLVYEDHLHKAWLQFRDAEQRREEQRNYVSKWLWGSSEEQYQRALSQLVITIGCHLVNSWQQDSVGFWSLFEDYLKHTPDLTIQKADDTMAPHAVDEAPSLDSQAEQSNALDEVLSPETLQQLVRVPAIKARLLKQCAQWIRFDQLYERIIEGLTSIVTELSEKNRISGVLLERLLQDSDLSSRKVRQAFELWLEEARNSGQWEDALRKMEQWKRVQHPRQSAVVFVVASYFFDELLPDYFQCQQNANRFSGRFTPVSIGRRKDFWNSLRQASIDLRIQAVLNEFKPANRFSPQQLIQTLFSSFYELDPEITTADPCRFPGFAESVAGQVRRQDASSGLLTGIARFGEPGNSYTLGLFVSNHEFQAGAFDMASAERLCRLLDYAAKSRYPVMGLICSGGMQTKEGAAALFSMAVVNDAINRFTSIVGLPVLIVGYGDCTGGAQASLVTHPGVETWYLSGTNMPFAGRIVVPDYLPVSATLANYLCDRHGSMKGLLKHPLAPGLDTALQAIDPRISLPGRSLHELVEHWVQQGESLKDVSALPVEQLPSLAYGHISSVLIHARGCTAVKLVDEAHAMGLRVVLVQSDPDMHSIAADLLNEQDSLVCLGGFTPDESYLNAHSVIHIAELERADALHPGIGFLSESYEFASLCLQHGLIFVGPSPAAMQAMGDKSQAIRTAMAAGVPVVPGSTTLSGGDQPGKGLVNNEQEAFAAADKIGYPVILKAAYGGGGKGISVVYAAHELAEKLSMIKAQARSAFGKDAVYLEHFVERFRHIEVQVLRDKFGCTRILGLRDCSVQRDKQKIIEESGSTLLPLAQATLAKESAARLAEACDYTGAGTVEYIYDLNQQKLYFMEMNTRLQVEHPVTEMVSGVDIVRAQFRIAMGKSIDEIPLREKGYAIEVRINAERIHLSQGGLAVEPSPGKVTRCHYPQMSDCRAIWAIGEDKTVPTYYDNLIAQIIAWGNNREEAIDRLSAYLDEIVIEGIATNLPLLRIILDDEVFRGGDFDTHYLPSLAARKSGELAQALRVPELKTATDLMSQVHVAGTQELKVLAPSTSILYRSPSPDQPAFVREGDTITANQTLCLLEVMKMFQPLSLSSFNQAGQELYPAHTTYRVTHVKGDDGQQVNRGDLLFVIEPQVA
ncbi:MAG: ATP-grasp domain-containing protein [Hahellaceae bacterium]|nr:ATP-grasp domain-containing protein [Hahellaceae bacterium]